MSPKEAKASKAAVAFLGILELQKYLKKLSYGRMPSSYV